MRKPRELNQHYTLTETVNLDPGTLLVNVLYKGARLRTVKEYQSKGGRAMIQFQYTDYGRFTGRFDAMGIFAFERLRNEGKLKGEI